jgi:autotransporter-associated beta strand protein
MKTKTRSRSLNIATGTAIALAPVAIHAAALTWDGGGADDKWSTNANWVGDPVADPASADTLTFSGTNRLAPVNDLSGLVLGTSSITFASEAGAFDITGQPLTLGTSSGGGYTVITQASAANQTITANLTLGSGGGDRSVAMSGSGKLTLAGNLNFSNSWLFPNTSAGTIVLSGNNSGDGKGAAISAGNNQLRATIGNNVAGTQLVLASDTALGNATSGDVTLGTAAFRGIQARQQTNISTVGDRNLSAYAIAINASNVTFNGSDRMIIGHIINQGGNRDFVVSGAGQVTVSNGISFSNDQTGRALYVNLSGTGGVVVNGKLYDTFHSGGVTSGQSTLRKAGNGQMALNGDSSSYTGLITIEGGTLKIGHANALGANGSGSGTTLSGNGILDLNGITSGETITINSSSNKIINSNASAARLSADATLNADLTVDATGDITFSRLIGAAVRTITKTGGGTLTTDGAGHNNLSAWDITAGTVVFANTSGYASDRGTTLNGGTLRISGSNSNLINDGQSFTINSGTFDLNGKSEAVASIDGTGGTITNTNAAAATLYVGGGVTGSSSASYGGVIGDGSGVLNLTKEGSGSQTLTGINTYSGTTTVAAGGLIVNGSISTSSLTTIAEGALLGGSGTLGTTTIAGTHSPGNSPGLQTFTGDLTYAPGASVVWELIANSTSGRGSTYDAITISGSGDLTFAGATRLDLNFALPGSAVDWTDTLWSQAVTGVDGWKLFDLDTGGINGLANLAIQATDWTDGSGRTLSSVRPGATFSLFQSGNDLYLGYAPASAIPEPGSLLGIGLLLGGPLALRRRK